MSARLAKCVWMLAAFPLLLVPSRAQAQEAVEYYGVDGVGSVRVVFSASGTLLSRVDYGPFGEQIATSTLVPKAYAGLFRDGEAGLDYAEARSYQTRTGRLTAVDPLFTDPANPQRWNRYTYALNNPVSLTDKTGLNAENEDDLWSRFCGAESSFENCGGDWLFWGSGGQSGGTGGFTFGQGYADALERGYVPGMPADLWSGLEAFNARVAEALKPAPVPNVETSIDSFEVALCAQPLAGCEDGKLPPVSMAGVPSPGAAGAAVVAIGARGEQLVRAAFDIGQKVMVQVNGRFRIPDGSLQTVVTEIKNVSYLSNTLQLRDLAASAVQNGQRLDLWIRTNTVVSGPLQQVASSSNGMIRIIPVLPPR